MIRSTSTCAFPAAVVNPAVDEATVKHLQLLKPEDLNATGRISSLDDIKDFPQVYRQACQQAIYTAFVHMSHAPLSNEISLIRLYDHTKKYLSDTAQQVIDHEKTSEADYWKIKSLLNSATALIPINIGNLEGGKFPKTGTNLHYSLIRLDSNRIVHLVNSPKPDTLRAIETAISGSLQSKLKPANKPGKAKPRLVIGAGGQGKVRLGVIATETLQQDIIPLAIKKVIGSKHACVEIKNAKQLQSPYLPKFYGSAKTLVCKDSGEIRHKYYLGYEYIHGSDGEQHAKEVADLADKAPYLHEEAVSKIVHHYAKAVDSLHQLGYAHSDIKLENFLHRQDGGIYLSDLGFAHNTLDHLSGGTYCYLPPECKTDLYNAQQHDNFSLGVAMLACMFGGIDQIPELPFDMTSSPQPDGQEKHFALTAKFERNNIRLNGLKNTQGLQVNYVMDVIIRLLDENPKQRMTAAEAARHFEKSELLQPTRSLDQHLQDNSLQLPQTNGQLPPVSEIEQLMGSIKL